MEIDEHWKHSNRRQVIKLLAHLRTVRQAIGRAIDNGKFIGSESDTCRAIQGNLEALAKGVEETIVFCGQAADDYKQAMQDPDARPAPITAQFNWIPNITPMQRALIREGSLAISDLPTHMNPVPVSQKKAPLVFPPSTLRKQHHKRRRTKNNIPL